MNSVKYKKDKLVTARINSDIKAHLENKGMTIQKIIDEYVNGLKLELKIAGNIKKNNQ